MLILMRHFDYLKWRKIFKASAKCLEIRNSWGKVMERSGLRLEHICLTTTIPDGLETSVRRAYR